MLWQANGNHELTIAELTRMLGSVGLVENKLGHNRWGADNSIQTAAAACISSQWSSSVQGLFSHG